MFYEWSLTRGQSNWTKGWDRAAKQAFHETGATGAAHRIGLRDRRRLVEAIALRPSAVSVIAEKQEYSRKWCVNLSIVSGLSLVYVVSRSRLPDAPPNPSPTAGRTSCLSAMRSSWAGAHVPFENVANRPEPVSLVSDDLLNSEKRSEPRDAVPSQPGTGRCNSHRNPPTPGRTRQEALLRATSRFGNVFFFPQPRPRIGGGCHALRSSERRACFRGSRTSRTGFALVDDWDLESLGKVAKAAVTIAVLKKYLRRLGRDVLLGQPQGGSILP